MNENGNKNYYNNNEELDNDELMSQYYYTNNNSYSNNNYQSNYNNYNQNNYSQNSAFDEYYNNGGRYIEEEETKPKKRYLVFFIIIIFVIIIIGAVTFAVINLSVKYTISFDLNGATNIQNAPEECKSNIFGHCYVTLPNVTRDNGEVIGYSFTADSTNIDYKIGEEIELKEDIELYVVSKNVKKVTIDTSNIDEIENESVSCTIYNKEDKCKVTLPEFNKKGYLNMGYSVKKDDTKGMVYPGDEIVLTEDGQYYPIYGKYSLNNKFNVSNISKTVKLNSGYVEITNACVNKADKIVDYLKIIEAKYPFIIRNNKVTIMSSDEFHNYYRGGNGVKGITFGDKSYLLSVFLPCDDNTIDMYAVTFHELMHVFDIGSKDIMGKQLSNSNELIDIAKKYYRNPSNPLRDYAFYSKEEFFAELLTYYYFSYVESSYKLSGAINYHVTLPDDLKKLAEKNICIGNNNHDASKC